MSTKRTTDTILEALKEMLESKKDIPKQQWLDAAFFLNLLSIDDKQLLNKMRQAVAIKKFEIYKGQTKRNVSAVDLEVETMDEYRFMKDQEVKIYAIEQLVMIAKKNADY